MRVHPYASAAYAAAFSPLEPVWLRHAATHVLKRPVPGTKHHDAMGCYPLCVLQEDDGIEEDFEMLKQAEIATLVAVTDCLSQPDEAFLAAHFDRVDVSLHRVVVQVRGSQKGTGTFGERIIGVFHENVVPFDCPDARFAGRVDPPGRYAAGFHGGEVLRPGKRRDYPKASGSGDAADFRLQHSRGG